MALSTPTRRLGFDFLGVLGSAVTDTENFLYNAASGNITSAQVAAVSAQGDQAIAQASGGNAALAAQQQAEWHAQLAQVVKQGYYGGWGNLLADLGVDSNAPGGVGSTGFLAWLEANWIWVFAGTAAFLIFRPDKALTR